MGGWRSLHQDAEPAEGIGPGKHMLFRLWNRRAGHSVKAVASGDEIAQQLNLLIFVEKSYARLARRDIRQMNILDVEKNGSALIEACGNTILDDFMLRVKRDGFPIRQCIQVNAMPLSIKAKLDAMMDGTFAFHAFIETHFRHQIDRALFENTGANRRFDLFSAPAFENERINPFQREEEREQ